MTSDEAMREAIAKYWRVVHGTTDLPVFLVPRRRARSRRDGWIALSFLYGLEAGQRIGFAERLVLSGAVR